jgi:endonuclease/exonuclease/phosphatase family metal-dependent hydrolase
MKPSALVFFCVLTTNLLIAQSLPIEMDGEFDDWEVASLMYSIDESAPAPTGIHVKRVWAANDDRFLFIKIEVDRDISLQETNPLVLLIDTDNNASNGAELRWEFGSRRGSFQPGSTAHSIQYSNIRLRTAPTVTSSVFEIAIGRDAQPNGSIPLFSSDTVTIQFQSTGHTTAIREYTFDPKPVPAPEPIPLERFDESDVRVLSFNAWSDKLFDAQFTNQYQRILVALDPDIIAFQEIWNHDAAQTAQRVESLLPSADGDQWHAVKLDQGNVTVSKYPILESWRILDQYRLTASLIDLPEAYATDLMLVNIHLRCCSGGEPHRWNEVAAVTEFVADAPVPEGTPIVLAGDFNLVGDRGQLAGIEADGLIRVRARQTQKRMNYTWRNDGGSYSPGKLDYIFYTGSSLTLKNKYTLQVEEMSPDQRSLYGLLDGDTQVASDHLPHVADFELKKTTSSIEMNGSMDRYSLDQNFPNPFNPATMISFTIPESVKVEIDVFDQLGRRVARLVNETFTTGLHEVAFDASALPSGIFLIRMVTGEQVFTRKMTLMK